MVKSEKEFQELESALVAVGQECPPSHPDLRIIVLSSLNSNAAPHPARPDLREDIGVDPVSDDGEVLMG